MAERQAPGPGYRAVILPISALLMATAFLIMGSGVQVLALPIRAEILDFSNLTIGFLGTGYFAGFVVGCLYSPRIVQTAGHIRTFAALVAVASAVVLLHAIVGDPVIWIICRFATGICVAGISLVLESWLHDYADNTNRGVVMSTYVGINLTVMTIGQMIATGFEPSRFEALAISSILVSFAAVPIALTRSAQPAPLVAVRLRPRYLFKLSPAGFVGSFLIGMAHGAFWTLTPVVARGAAEASPDYGPQNAVAYAAWFMSAAVIGGALAQAPLGKISDRMERRVLLILICGLSAIVGIFVIQTLGTSLGYWTALFFGAVTLPAYAVAAAHVFDFTPKEDIVEASSALLMVNAAGSAIGAPVAAASIDAMGGQGLYWFNGLVQILLIGYVVWRMRIREAPPEEIKVQYDFAATSPVISTAATDLEHGLGKS
ncbi:MFS transporter [Pedomonas mirosovicensis]|uniref:MFS transporter n=1 Tax=Pedomonas mirosovicensis TaxID=2908641 RepID=UPI0021673E21|nr:MFS transporter [Pedomonas mirosovicensis]MCH8684908.1 MFS transporter [Pedomonas mirosovicensis]